MVAQTLARAALVAQVAAMARPVQTAILAQTEMCQVARLVVPARLVANIFAEYLSLHLPTTAQPQAAQHDRRRSRGNLRRLRMV
jgi:hypothetical protein